ncbi:phage virion morphogenesis protein [Phocaeicola plebeius]|uniref:phage virion morphogenesis protein n=1 Tax=Phocaeicola plebeius TaxID=310297 RepID=UPI003FD80802
MYIKDFAKLIEQKRKELDKMMRRKMPVIAGRMAKDHFQENFRQGGFVNGGLNPWPQAKRLSSGGTDAASNYGTLLSSRNHLFSSIKYIPSDYRVKVSNELVYAPIHNWGGTVSVTVTDRMRRFAWAKFYKASGHKRKANTGQKKGTKRHGKQTKDNPQASFWKGLALTKKKKLNIHIPQRQFLGESKELTDKINERIEKEIRTILNS